MELGYRQLITPYGSMVLMGWLKRRFAEARTQSGLEQLIISRGLVLPYREPTIPRVLLTLRRISWRVALTALITVFITGFFLRDYARYGLRAGDTPPDTAWLWIASLSAGILFAILHVVAAALVQRRWQLIADQLLKEVPHGEEPTEYLDPTLLRKFVDWPASMSAGSWLVVIALSLGPFFAIGEYRNPLMRPLSGTDPLAVMLAVAVVALLMCSWLVRLKHRRYGAWPHDSALYDRPPSNP